MSITLDKAANGTNVSAVFHTSSGSILLTESELNSDLTIKNIFSRVIVQLLLSIYIVCISIMTHSFELPLLVSTWLY